MRVLVMTTVLPGGRRGGGEVVTDGMLAALRGAGLDVRVLGYRRPEGTPPERAGETCVGSRSIETSAAGPRAAAWMARALVRRDPYTVAKYDSRAYRRAAREELGGGVAAVVADHAQVGFALPPGPVPPLVFVAHNSEADVYAELAEEASGRAARWAYAREARLIRGVEAGLAARASQVWTLTREDRDGFLSIRPGADVRALGVASAIDPAPPAAPRYDVGLIGTWTWRANARGLEWFASEVVPRLPESIAIEVAGSGAEWLRGRHPNVAVRGVVDDAREFLAAARVAAVPAIAGGGVQVKTLDAVACGVPVVVTPLALRGVDDPPASVAVADDGARFAAELERLAAHADRERLSAEATAWSLDRRERFRATVAGGIRELAGAEAGRPLAADGGRSRTPSA